MQHGRKTRPGAAPGGSWPDSMRICTGVCRL